ncbi:FAD/NAD(P)-binding domain-containing protein [Wilcoxina mikolae CBS 423.85]|nr:FAD/NAD(P)-binding domain-containing protein [Wilcoxina mikolae CBS 423.85]
MTSPTIPQATKTSCEHHSVIIVGAGPSGLFLALKLVREGIDVLVLEVGNEISQSPRATTYVPIVLHEFEKVGLYDSVAAAGHKNEKGIIFRTPHCTTNEVLATVEVALMPKGVAKYSHTGIHLGQHQLAAIILEHAQKHPSFSIKWGQRFSGCREVDGKVEIVTAGAQGELWYTADYLVGADGAGSAVRKALCIPFEGFTWKDRFVASNVYYDFEKYEGYSTANMVVDTKDWAVIARTGKPEEGLWRVAFGVSEEESAGMDNPEVLRRKVAEKYEALFPGPRPLQYKLQSANPYWAHQRVATEFKRGRAVLCGDAGHKDPDALLQRYAEVRRNAFVEYTNSTSIANKLRLQSDDPEVVRDREAFFARVNGDPEFLREMANQMNEVLEDNFEVGERWRL